MTTRFRPEKLPPNLFVSERRMNLYILHRLFQDLADFVSRRLKDEHGIDVPLTSGMWGGSYLIADDDGIAKSNVIRLYCIVNLPQGSPLEEKENFEHLMKIYAQTFQETFSYYNLRLENPQWGEPIPCTNRIKPTTALQLWDRTNRVKFVRAFFVWNSASWEEAIIYDMVRNVKQVKELLDINRRPGKKNSEELKFLLQDVLIIYHTLRGALTPDFVEHAEPMVQKLLKQFLNGLYVEEKIEEEFYNVYGNALVYGFEEALDEPYRKYNLDIHKVEDWPIEKINWVPPELQEKIFPLLREKFSSFQAYWENSEKKNGTQVS